MVDDSNSIQEILPSRVIIDASLVVARLIDDENSQGVDAFFEQSTQEKITLAAPSLIIYEIANALLSAVRRGRITQNQATGLVNQITQLHIDTSQLAESEKIIALAAKLDISAYDAAYVALAKQLDEPLYTLDAKLQRKVGSTIVCVIVI